MSGDAPEPGPFAEEPEEDVFWELPAPPPTPFVQPLPPPGKRMLFLRSDEPGRGGRDHEDIMLRRVPRETAMRFRAAAGGRGLTHAQYLTALVDLHRRVRELADAGDERLRAELAERGLGSVTV
jgi:hypothetical protein